MLQQISCIAWRSRHRAPVPERVVGRTDHIYRLLHELTRDCQRNEACHTRNDSVLLASS